MLRFSRALVAIGLLALMAPISASGLQSTSTAVASKLAGISEDCQLAAKSLLSEECSDVFLIEFNSAQDQNVLDAQLAEKLVSSYSFLNVSAFELNGQDLGLLAKSPSVKKVIENSEFSIAATQTQSDAQWHLDRIDGAAPVSPTGPFSYSYDDTELGSGVRIYIVDTGINTSHQEFTGRTIAGYSSVGADPSNTLDCNGHGTHVAALAGGTTFGAAKQATIVPVRVLDCDGSGTLLGVLQGLDWIANNTFVGQPAVVNMSLGGDRNSFLDSAIENLTSQGLAFVVAAGNTAVDASNVSPAASPGAIAVGASAINDSWASFSNFGSEVDIIAPGVDVRSAWYSANTTTAVASGTSMAAGIVSGIVANQMTYGYQSPSNLLNALVTNSVSGAITGVPGGTTNQLLQNAVAFSAGGSATNTNLDAPDTTVPDTQLGIVDPVQPSPTTPTTPTPAVPVSYAKPTVGVAGSVATASWTIPTQTTALTGQVLKVLSGTTEIASHALAADATSFVIPNLATGVVYRITVAGVNSVGTGIFSPESDPFEILEQQPLLGPAGGEFSAWVKKISDTQVKFYAKFPQIGQKIQFMVQDRSGVYREIAWLRVTDSRIDQNGEYIGLQNRIYFIRTIDLRDGKNRLRILVDGELLDRTRTYTL